jgi:hypothetical protein
MLGKERFVMTKNISQLLAQVDALARKHSQPDVATRILMPFVSLMSLGLIPAHTPADPNKLKYVEMPEEWLAVVRCLPCDRFLISTRRHATGLQRTQ